MRSHYRHLAWWEVALAGVCVLALVLVIGSRHQIHPRLVGAYVGERISCAGGTTPYVAPASAWGQTACTVIVASPYDYEASLTPGQYPDGDSDYIHAGVQQWVILPGWGQDRWRLVYAFNIAGSGCAQGWAAPNGGLVALLHLTCGVGYSSGYYTGAQIPLPPRSVVGARHTMTNEELDALTIRAISAHMKAGVSRIPTLTTVSGGTRVGLSRWPDNPAFGAGVAGPANAHLCVITTSLSSTWLYQLEHGLIRRTPPPFPLKAWFAYRKGHHWKRLLSPYDRHHHLYRAARAWRSHARTFRGVVSRRYFPKTKTRKDAFTAWRFRCGRAWVWARTGRVKIRRVKCLK